jgi:indolepyruvate ferredoxin oxidoreductase beta subunit
MSDRPITILIAALGGEGGGVLADWLIAAATARGLPAQSTSIPGVAQRTGATTYYLEIFQQSRDSLGGRRPVFALTPNPGNVDIMVASELLEAGRAMQNGYVSPDRTTLIASTHRIFAIAEKSAMGDGRVDTMRIHRAAQELARRPVLFDMARLAQASGSVINAVLFGAMAGSGALPLSRGDCEAAIRGTGKAVDANLRGFAAGFAHASGEMTQMLEAVAPRQEKPQERVRRVFPMPTHHILDEGVARVIDYQDAAYGDLYVDYLRPILAADGAEHDYKLTSETGRHLALWMSYEDVIRVADLKTRANRYARVREETGAKPHEPVVVVEYLKPGVDEICAILPARLGAWLLARARDRGWINRLNIGLHLKTTTISGFAMLRLVAAFKPMRRRSLRFQDEHALIGRWLDAIGRTAARDYALALEIAECARLLKGYGDTQHRGRQNFLKIFEGLVLRSLEGRGPADPVAAIRAARLAALADPEGDALDRALAQYGVIGSMPALAAE